MKPYSKSLSHLLACLALSIPLSSSAITVIDPTHIKISLLNAKKDLVQQIRQESNQKMQIFKLNHQISQVEEYLKRLGRPQEVDLRMIREILNFLKRTERNKRSEQITKDIGDDEVFESQPRSGPHQQVSREIVVDGKVVAKRNGAVFSSEVAARRTFEHYRSVKSKALDERRKLNGQIGTMMIRLEKAKTSSEVQKMAVVLSSLQSQLAATDREVSFAADEALTRFLHNENEKAVAAKERVQNLRTQLRVGTEKDLDLYKLPTKPFLFPREQN